MGGQLAVVLAIGSRQTFLMSRKQQTIDNSLKSIDRYASDLHRHGLLQEEPSKVVERIKTGTSLEEAAANAELVVESVTEDLEVKVDVFKRLGEATEPHYTLKQHLGLANKQ